MGRKVWVLSSVMAAAFVVTTNSSDAKPRVRPTRYSIQALNPLSGQDACYGYALNSSGVAVGLSVKLGTTSPNLYRAVRWTNGTSTLLPGPTNQDAFAYDINDTGEVAGESIVGSGNSARYHAVVWRNGAATDLHSLTGSEESGANSINNAGAIAGAGNEGFILSGSTRFDIPQGSTQGLVPRAINDNGAVAGESFTSAGDRAFLWSQEGLTVLSVPARVSETTAYSINNNNQVVGKADERAITWENGAPTLLPGLSKKGESVAYAVSDDGRIVGRSAAGKKPRAVLWENGKVIDLNTRLVSKTGWSLETAHDRNAAGQIVGSGVLSGRRCGFLLTPVTP